MDPRINRWAKTLVQYCLSIQPGEILRMDGTPAAEDLIAEVYRETLRAGGHPVVNTRLPQLSEIALKEGSDDQLGWINPADRVMIEAMDARLHIMSETNTRQLSGVDPKRQAVAGKAGRELFAARSAKVDPNLDRWCLTLFPTEAFAQDAEMSLSDFTEFVYDACFLNSEDPAERWRELGRQQQFYCDWLKDKQEAHVIGPDTDIRVKFGGRIFRNSDGKRNFPSGEFFTSPLEDSAEGHIRFTVPSVVNGHLVSDIRLTFEQGRVVESRAAQGETFLKEMLASDDGASRLGEFAVGNNFGIQHGIRNILFDEKIGGTIHMALGNSYRECGGKNTSQLHWDMVCDLREAAGGGEVWVDGTLLLKDGKLVLKP
ncbi:MAG TPA: aminopeptidase [Ktedonobacterales bacterium]|jgi:aminopeptidase|nr:aminopeptidase [Ktedonobacterales bacterium]